VQDQLRHRELWYRGIFDELLWWEGWLASAQGVQWGAEVQQSKRPVREPLLVKRLGDWAQASVSVLDVGAGPVSSLGNTFPGKTLDITAVDPLANLYRRTLRDRGITPSLQTLPCHGEKLLKRFSPGSFDIAYARNALDHSYDPLLVIQNMLVLVKPEGYVLLRHYRNEGKIGSYRGLHQWNFDLLGGSLIVWNAGCEHNISQMFCQEAQIECYVEDSRNIGGFDYSEWVVCALKKTASAQRPSSR
jgi:SAM-dependent methyltransferase